MWIQRLELPREATPTGTHLHDQTPLLGRHHLVEQSSATQGDEHLQVLERVEVVEVAVHPVPEPAEGRGLGHHEVLPAELHQSFELVAKQSDGRLGWSLVVGRRHTPDASALAPEARDVLGAEVGQMGRHRRLRQAPRLESSQRPAEIVPISVRHGHTPARVRPNTVAARSDSTGDARSMQAPPLSSTSRRACST